MKKIVILSYLGVSLFAAGDYIPLSKLSDDEKVGYNFTDKKDIIKPVESKNYTSVSKKNNEIIQPVENNKIKEKIKDVNKVEVSETNNDLAEKENIIEEFKKENILQDVSKENKILKADNRDFSITPKISYSFLKSDIYIADRVSVVEERGVLIPEVAISYKNHTLKAETMSSKAYFEGVLIEGGDLSTDSSWDKLSYLYKYQNVNMGLGYNVYKIKGNFIFHKYDLIFNEEDLIFNEEDKEEFASLELHFKNEENNIQAEYGGSYGKNDNLDYAYDYYLNLGYKIFKDSLIVSAGYKNRTIEIEDVRFQYKGPTLGLSSTF